MRASEHAVSVSDLLGEVSPVAASRAPEVDRATTDPDEEWARSGAMALTGRPGRPLVAPRRIPGGLLLLGRLIAGLSARWGAEVVVDPLSLVTERAAIMQLSAGGDASCGGRARLMRTRSGWLGISLAREDDRELVPAWLEEPGHSGSWDDIARSIESRIGTALVARAALLGLPIAALGEVTAAAGPAVRARRLIDAAPRIALAGARVVDLSSLWAGPLCAHILQQAGAHVIKVESASRPDGARRAHASFFDLLNAGKESVALELGSDEGREALLDLLVSADIVIEASRPRALRQLGIRSEELLRNGPSVWVSLTGYGTIGEAAHRVAFGDDAAVAGGLVAWDEDRPCFCADAIADPAAGLTAAAAVLAALGSGRWHLDVALARVSAHLAGAVGSSTPWRAQAVHGQAAEAEVRRCAAGAARPFGQDTSGVLAEHQRLDPRNGCSFSG
jgi:hypothetical protein